MFFLFVFFLLFFTPFFLLEYDGWNAIYLGTELNEVLLVDISNILFSTSDVEGWRSGKERKKREKKQREIHVIVDVLQEVCVCVCPHAL
jgi:hypothetical protein